MTQPVSRLHKVVESVEGIFKYRPDLYKQDIIKGFLFVAAESARRVGNVFVLGEMVGKEATEHHGTIKFDFPFRLPYPITVLEYDAPFGFDEHGNKRPELEWRRETTVLLQNKPNEIFSLSFTKMNIEWVPSIFVHEFYVNEDEMLMCRLGVRTLSESSAQELFLLEGIDGSKARERCEGDISFMGAFLFQFLQVLQCTNIERKFNRVPKELMRSQQRKKSAVSFSFSTLHIRRQREKGETLEETVDRNRSAPRLHFRRGHVRRLAEGKRTWVAACMVGDEAKGEVRKQYSL